jgi:IclR family KDG regulon transcriptional repressor
MTAPLPGKSGQYRIQLLEKAVAILETFSTDRRELTIRDLVESTGQTRASVYRIVLNLVRLGLLERDSDGRRYRVASRLFAIGSLAVHDLRRVAMRHMQVIHDTFGCTVNLSIRQDRETVLIEILESRSAFRMASSVGSREPIYCTAAGKCLIAFEPPDVRESLMRSIDLRPYTPATVTSIADLRQMVNEARDRLYAIDNGEFEAHGRCVAVPVFDRHGAIAAALSVSGPADLIEGSRLDPIVSGLRDIGRTLSSELGALDSYPPASVVRAG